MNDTPPALFTFTGDFAVNILWDFLAEECHQKEVSRSGVGKNFAHSSSSQIGTPAKLFSRYRVCDGKQLPFGDFKFRKQSVSKAIERRIGRHRPSVTYGNS